MLNHLNQYYISMSKCVQVLSPMPVKRQVDIPYIPVNLCKTLCNPCSYNNKTKINNYEINMVTCNIEY